MQGAPSTSPAPFLERDPPHWAVSGLAYLLVLFFAAAVLAAVFVRIPEVVAAPFQLVPVHGVDPVRAPRRGVVAAVRVREGDVVRRDQPLALIGSEEVGDRWSELRTLETQAAGAEQAVANLRDERANERQAEQEEERGLRDRVAVLERMVALRKQQITLSEEFVDRRRRLFEEGLTNREEVTRAQLDAQEHTLQLAELESERASVQRTLARLVHEIEARDAAFREEERRLNEGAATSRIRADQLRNERIRSDGAAVELAAPCAGIVLRLGVRASGAVVQEGDVIGEVACQGERLQAEVSVPQTGVARLREGLPVKLLYDAFPYQRFGVRYGTVSWVSPATTGAENRGGFRVLVEPTDTTFDVDGRSQRPVPGMTGIAHVVVGRRSLLEYAVGPLRQLRERLTTPPAGPDEPAGRSSAQ